MMNDVVRSGFQGTVQALAGDLAIMPFSRWNESVLRHHFSRSIATTHRDVEQLVECDRIDLVLVQAPARAFIEFKFYARRFQFDANGLDKRGFKGGPGRKNLGEFQACVDKLYAREAASGLSKYIVLVYGDPKVEGQPRLTYARHYEEYQHPRAEVLIRLVDESATISGTDVTARVRLYEIATPQQRNGS